MSNSQRFTVTAALPYANGPKHIGHLAGAYLPADVFCRYLRLAGEDVLFICGSDEHGAAITLQALAEQTTPKEIVDKYHELVKTSFEKLGISFDIYHRTSAPIHHETASNFFLNLYHKGLLIEKTSEQYFDEVHNTFIADRYITGTCPNCGNEKAYGDQCERCGKSLSPDDLINPHSVLSGASPVKKSTKHWYLPLQDYEKWLSEWILEGHQNDWKPNVYGQCKSWIEQGLAPRAVTRDLDWGVKVPLEEAEGKVLYVWFDAPIGYISATRQWAEDNRMDWEIWWKNPSSKLIHFIGKDNIVFHCIIFPAMLKAHGDYILPENVPSNEFMNLEGEKMSTSRHWSVEMHEYLEDFPGKEDILRYVLLSNLPETKDSEFTWKDFQTKNNSELVGILGNLVNRVFVLTHKYFEGKVPNSSSCEINDAEISKTAEAVGDSIRKYRFREAMQEMMNLARYGNKLLADKEPWKLINTDDKATAAVLFDALQILSALSVLSEPFLPKIAAQLREMLNFPNKLTWKDIGRNDLLSPGHELKPAQILIEKIEDPVINAQIEKLKNKSKTTIEQAEAKLTPIKPEIQFDDFAKMDLRTGTVLQAEKVEKADKLLKLTVDIGIETRTIVSGIAAHFTPEELVGTQVMVLANLAPRKIRGIESKGMLLLAENTEGKLILMKPEENSNPGACIN